MSGSARSGRAPGRAACIVGTVRALGTFLLVAAAMAPLHLMLRQGRRTAAWAPRIVHQHVCRALDVTAHVHGTPHAQGPVLYVANHVSWLDIFVLGSLLPAAFVAKSEVRAWPLVGWLARLQPTLFVVRADRRAARAQAEALGEMLISHGAAILFAEGTSTDGSGVAAFKTALFAALHGVPGLRIQPLTIAYTSLSGQPVDAQNRDRVAWYDDMTLPPHLYGLAGETEIGVDLMFHTAFEPEAGADRRAIAHRCETEVRRGHAALTAPNRCT